MESTDIVSIVVPVYNADAWLSRCISSIVAQSHQRLDVILIDDGSTDDSGALCVHIAEEDRRFRVVHGQNKGPSAARNHGIGLARGRWLVFVDADDWLPPDAIDTLVASQARTAAQLTIGDFVMHRGHQQHPGHGANLAENQSFDRGQVVSYVRRYLETPYQYLLFNTCWAKLYDLSIIRAHSLHFDERLHNLEDVSFNYQYLLHCDLVHFERREVYHYVVHDHASQSMRIGDDPQQFSQYKHALDVVERFLLASGADFDVDQAVGHLRVSYAIIMVIRTCGQVNSMAALGRAQRLVRYVANAPDFQNNLPHYHPTGKDSRWVPFLLKHRVILPTIALCRYKFVRHRKARRRSADGK